MMARYIRRTDMVLIDGEEVPGHVMVERTTVEIPPSMLPEPDPDWTYTDRCDHKHRYDDGYPTLKRVVIGRQWCYDCHEHHEDIALVCRWCGEEIRPEGRPPSPFPTYTDGTVSWSARVDRYLKRGTVHKVEAEGMSGKAVVTASSLSSSGEASSVLMGMTELSERPVQ